MKSHDDIPAAQDESSKLIRKIEQILQEVIEGFAPDVGAPTGGRPRVLPAMALWAGLLLCVLRGFHSQLAVWRALTQWDLWFPTVRISDQAVYKRLAQGGTTALEQLFEHLSTLVRERFHRPRTTDLAPFATDVVAVDESTLDQVARWLPSLRAVPAGDDRLLPGKVAALFDVRAQQWRRLKIHDDPHQNEKKAAREMVADLPKGSLILADLGYFGFEWFDWLTDNHYWWISRLRAKTSYQVAHTYYQRGDVFDGLVWLGAHRSDRAANLARLVCFRRGATLFRYVTNVTDPTMLPLGEIARIYARRWDIELGFKLVKQQLNLHLLWSAKPAVIHQQVWAVFIIAQVLLALRMEVAVQADVDPFDVSMQLLIEAFTWFARDGRDPLAELVRRGRESGCIRPSRRTVIHAPDIPPEAMMPLPDGFLMVRPPRYAHRRCTSQSITAA